MNKFCAGIVTFNPSLDRLENVVNSIIPQVDKLVIVDNGSNDTYGIKKILQSWGEKAILLLNNENKGIAYALNRICFFSKENGYGWVLTLDQDTICPSNLIEGLAKGINIENVGIICPSVKYEGVNIKTGNKFQEIEDDTACMTSASLTNLSAWEDTGGFRDDYFIDFVDNEFCMKLRIKDYRIIRINSCTISHQLGDSVERRFLGKIIKGTAHKPWRMYYMVRNNLLFIKENKTRLNVLKEYMKVLYIIVNELYFANQKSSVVSYAWKGYIDAMHNKLGKMK